jgi:ATP-dependent Clp protease protease subunit
MMKPTFFAKAKGKTGDLYIYEDIGSGWFGGIGPNDVKEALDEVGSVDTLNIYINSPGGSVFDGMAIYNQLKRFAARKVVHIDGIAASIASVIAMAGDEIVCAPNAMMMIHDPFGIAAGTAKDKVGET